MLWKHRPEARKAAFHTPCHLIQVNRTNYHWDSAVCSAYCVQWPIYSMNCELSPLVGYNLVQKIRLTGNTVFNNYLLNVYYEPKTK